MNTGWKLALWYHPFPRCKMHGSKKWLKAIVDLCYALIFSLGKTILDSKKDKKWLIREVIFVDWQNSWGKRYSEIWYIDLTLPKFVICTSRDLLPCVYVLTKPMLTQCTLRTAAHILVLSSACLSKVSCTIHLVEEIRGSGDVKSSHPWRRLQ